jgi:hypothetical protein
LSAENTSRPIRARFLITSQPTKSALLLTQKSIHLEIRQEHVNNGILEYVYGGMKSLKKWVTKWQYLKSSLNTSVMR